MGLAAEISLSGLSHQAKLHIANRQPAALALGCVMLFCLNNVLAVILRRAALACFISTLLTGLLLAAHLSKIQHLGQAPLPADLLFFKELSSVAWSFISLEAIAYPVLFVIGFAALLRYAYKFRPEALPLGLRLWQGGLSLAFLLALRAVRLKLKA